MCAPREARRTMYRDVVRKRSRARKARKCVSRVVRRAPVLLTVYTKRPLSLRYATQPTGKRRLEVTELTSNGVPPCVTAFFTEKRPSGC